MMTSHTEEMNIDTSREVRQGFPEVVFGRGKTCSQVIDAMNSLVSSSGHALATGVAASTAEQLLLTHPSADWRSLSKTLSVGQLPLTAMRVAVVCAGTSDLSVAEEAAHTCAFLGHQVQRITDVGVAGIHRLMERLHEIDSCSVVIVVAGMEGTLPSVVGGLVSQPVIAVPTSVGYGTGLGGVAALMAMLNSCAAGVAVMNIDNGFGAAVMAHRILMLKTPTQD